MRFLIFASHILFIQTDIIISIYGLKNFSILDRAGPIVMFTHDLILEAVYSGMPLAERQKLHFQIGQCLGAMANINVDGPNHDQSFFGGRCLASTLISIACDQINTVLDSAGLDLARESFTSEKKKTFAQWNLAAGRQDRRHSNNRGALYYFENGIKWLGQNCWDERGLCLALHEGATMASFGLGEPDNVALFAEKVTSNTSFDDSLDIQPIVLKSLSQSGKHKESIARGIDILQKLDFDILSAMSIDGIIKAMTSTNAMASKYSAEQMISLCEKAMDDSVHQKVKIMDAFYASCYASSSPLCESTIKCIYILASYCVGYLSEPHFFATHTVPIIACEMMK